MKKIKENLPIISVVLLSIILISLFFILTKNSENIDELALGFSNNSSNTGVMSFNSLSENTSGSYDAFILRSGKAYLERILIGNSISNAGILIDNATANNLDAVRIADFTGLSVGSHEIGAYMDLGIMITTSEGLNATFIYTPME